MKKRLIIPIAALGLLFAAAQTSQAVQINIPDYSLVPDGQNLTTTFQHTNISTPNGGAVLPNSGTPTVYVIAKFNFGTASDAHLQWQFSTSATAANRIGIEVQDTGLVQTLGTGDGVLQAVSSTTPKRKLVNLNQDMAGQTVTLLAKLKYDSTLSATYDARTSFNGTQSTADDTLMNVWINPDASDVEGSGLSAGDLYALWNSAGFSYFRQTIQNQLTPNTAGTSSITNTVVLTGADATFVKALAIATGATPGIVSATISTVSASPTSVPADGTSTSTVTVTLKDAFGTPISGKDVTLSNTSGPQAAVIAPLTAVTTDANGLAVFTVKSSTAGTEVFTATDTTDSLVINQTASVSFVSSADAALSTVAASPAYINADGTSTSTITVSLKAAGNAPVPGKSVTLAQTLGSGATITPGTAQTSDSNGQVVFTVKSSTPGAAEFTATDMTDSLAVTQKGTVQFVGPGDAATSTVVASRGSVVANGTSSSAITVTLKDAAGFPAQNKDVSLAITSGPTGSVITPPSATTNTSGQAVFTVTSTTIGTNVFTATDTSDTVVIAQTATVTFVDPAVPLSFNVNFVQFTPGLGNFEDPATLAGPAGGSGQTWNQYRAASGSNLLASDGTATAVGVTTNFTECRSRSTGALTLLKHGLTDFDKGLSRTVTISGLPPGSLYNVWLASTADMGAAAENANGAFSTTNSTSTFGSQPINQTVSANTTTWQQGNNYALLENVVVNGSGQIIVTAASTTGYRLPLSGFQLTPASRGRIISFVAAGNPGVINQGAFTISATVPFGTNLATLAPTFTLNSGACNQTSGSVPSPSFASANPVTYTVTDTSTDPVTVNNYSVTVTVAPPPPVTGTLVINLGNSPAGTFIEGGQFIGSGPVNLPLPALPTGSILRKIEVNAKLESSDNGTLLNYASDLDVLLDPTPGTPGGDFSLEITNGTNKFAGTTPLGWPSSANNGLGTTLVDTKTEADWAALGNISLNTTGLFLGNSYVDAGFTAGQGGIWSGTITLTYDYPSAGYAAWSGGSAADADSNGDGVKNAVAWALGAADLNANAIALLPVLDNTSDPVYAIFRFNRSIAANSDPATSIAVEYDDNLSRWTTAVHDGNNVIITTTPGSTTDLVEVKLKRSTLASGGKVFARLKVAITSQ